MLLLVRYIKGHAHFRCPSIFLLVSNTTKLYKFQIYYSNFSPLKEKWDYHNNKNLLQNYTAILTKIKMK